MTQHQFLLTPSSWLGQGKIQLNMVSEELNFFTRWNTSNVDGEGKIECLQEIQVRGLSDIMHNQFLLYNVGNGEFAIDLENQALGRITGKGIINDKVIAWEFRIEEIGFEGFELYEKQDEKNYLMRAEYATSDQFRTLIQGKVWQQTT
ncbi:MAG: hypothetical protein HYX67_13995 [Candidatus Melainabacteria bacterium]|nr:hypothetical protein [Candidatus Melainabacteria bacterium]